MINEAKNSFQSLLPYFNPPITKEYNETLLLAEKMGLKLHFDMHTIAQSPSSPQKMDEIRNIVSQIMFQPSLLAYYIGLHFFLLFFKFFIYFILILLFKNNL